MAKIALVDVGSGYQTATQQNANNDTVETHLNDKVLYRDNPSGEANTMQQELDMNSNQITNVSSPNNNADAATKLYVDSLISGTTDTGAAQLRIDLASDTNTEGASLIGIEDSAADFAATTVEGALAELVTESVALAGTQTITGDKTISGALIASGTSDLNGVNTLAGNTTVSGTLAATSTLAVTGVQTNAAMVTWSKGADLTDTDVDVSNILTVGTDGNYFDYTGTDQIDAIATVGVGTVIKIHFDAACVLTHHATNLILPGAASITTVAGDEAEFVEYASGDYRLTNYSRAAFLPIAALDAQLAKAWIKFDGTGVTAITSSYNFSSIDDDATGRWGLNFTTAMSDALYCVVTGTGVLGDIGAVEIKNSAVGSFDFDCNRHLAFTGDGKSTVDNDELFAAVFGD